MQQVSVGYLLALNRAKRRLIRTFWPGHKKQLCLIDVNLKKSPVKSNIITFSLSGWKVPSHSKVFYNEPPTCCLSFCYKWESQKRHAIHYYHHTGRSWRTAEKAAEFAGGIQRARELSPISEQRQVERDPALAVGHSPSPLPAETSRTGYETAGT